ncbi:adenylate/guanylate cyclase domain-containing protein [Trichlorobacter ammonificans]|uniref:Guanylate cyclase domain-containing protein n=1 Tax=Trichlorobacter ammonificans TaxID=2916410 RepID=A0ABN8HFI6_9BACT|nr:adenylate/guanylate cyclase domain-containing protein [Trichlorobacter ammonificans]CAH2030048.1 protein of unknown function [Trichlorobacter ammonificans]
MSAIVCFDIRNFSTHVSHLVAGNQGKSKRVFEVVKELFQSLDNVIRLTQSKFDFQEKTYVVHTGDGFVAIFYGKGKCLQALSVACVIGNDFSKIINIYNSDMKKEASLRNLPPLDYGIGIHIGAVQYFNYQPVYSSDSRTQSIGLLGHAINLASRVQDTTKEHVYRIICTRRVFTDSISRIDEEHRGKIDRYFIDLGKHKLRGMRRPVTLYGVDGHLYEYIKREIPPRQN